MNDAHNNSNPFNPPNPAESISHLYYVWYCFLAVAIVGPCLLFVYCVPYRTWERQRQLQEDQRAVQRDDGEQYEEDVEAQRRRNSYDMDISRIEANVKVFSEIEQQKRLNVLKRKLRKCTRVVTASDICEDEEADEASLSVHDTDIDLEKGASERRLLANCSTCGICLDGFADGDIVMPSCSPCCPHVYHKHCMLAWLASRCDHLCPFCRQPFVDPTLLNAGGDGEVDVVTPQTSLSSIGGDDGDSPTGRITGDDEDDESPGREQLAPEQRASEESEPGL